MLPKNRRIPRKMFPIIAGSPKTFRNNLFLLKITESKEPQSRFCFSVSKKVSKKAVTRNKLRRSGYRFVEKHLSGVQSGVLAIFYFKAVPKNNDELERGLESILKSSKLIS